MLKTLLFACSLCGCARNPDVLTLQLTPDPTCAPALEEVIPIINAAAGRELVLYGPGAWVVAIEARGEVCGQFVPARNTIEMAPRCRIDPQQERQILIHEIGHALGLFHNEADASSIMHPIYHKMTLEEAAASLVVELYR